MLRGFGPGRRGHASTHGGGAVSGPLPSSTTLPEVLRSDPSPAPGDQLESLKDEPEDVKMPATCDSNEQDITCKDDMAGLKAVDSHDVNGADVEIKLEVKEGQNEVSDSQVSGEEGNQQQQPPFMNRWKKARAAGVKRKKVPGARHKAIRKLIRPKNAVTCLNELKPGVVYVVEERKQHGPFCLCVEINGQKYRGFGSSKQLAKQAAAEAALISFVKPPITSKDGQEKDNTPWGPLVSFALYKLFNDWREGRVGICPPLTNRFGFSIQSAPELPDLLELTQPNEPDASTEENNAEVIPDLEEVGEPLECAAPIDDVEAEFSAVRRPDKQLPDNAATWHPVMLLHELRPKMHIDIIESMHQGKPFFTARTEVDAIQFSGKGTSIKKAKISLAKEALKELFGVESTFSIETQTPQKRAHSPLFHPNKMQKLDG